MSTQHTPGPWKLGALDITPFGTGFSMGIDAESHGELALVVWQMEEDKVDGKPSPQCEANAKLIAAAPDLLDALDLLLGKAYKQNFNDSYPEILAKAEAALAKARGEQ